MTAVTVTKVMTMCYRMDDSCRPVRLRKVVLGYPCSDTMSEFRFDLMLTYRLANVILTYSELKPTLVVHPGSLLSSHRRCTNSRVKKVKVKKANLYNTLL